jgi:hypothetical protein
MRALSETGGTVPSAAAPGDIVVIIPVLNEEQSIG